MKPFIVTVNSPGAVLVTAPDANSAATHVARQVMTVRPLAPNEMAAMAELFTPKLPEPPVATPDAELPPGSESVP